MSTDANAKETTRIAVHGDKEYTVLESPGARNFAIESQKKVIDLILNPSEANREFADKIEAELPTTIERVKRVAHAVQEPMTDISWHEFSSQAHLLSTLFSRYGMSHGNVLLEGEVKAATGDTIEAEVRFFENTLFNAFRDKDVVQHIDSDDFNQRIVPAAAKAYELAVEGSHKFERSALLSVMASYPKLEKSA